MTLQSPVSMRERERLNESPYLSLRLRVRERLTSDWASETGTETKRLTASTRQRLADWDSGQWDCEWLSETRETESGWLVDFDSSEIKSTYTHNANMQKLMYVGLNISLFHLNKQQFYANHYINWLALDM